MHRSPAYTHVPLSHWISLAEPKFKDQIIENFQTLTEECETKLEALLRAGLSVI